MDRGTLILRQGWKAVNQILWLSMYCVLTKLCFVLYQLNVLPTHLNKMQTFLNDLYEGILMLNVCDQLEQC